MGPEAQPREDRDPFIFQPQIEGGAREVTPKDAHKLQGVLQKALQDYSQVTQTAKKLMTTLTTAALQQHTSQTAAEKKLLAATKELLMPQNIAPPKSLGEFQRLYAIVQKQTLALTQKNEELEQLVSQVRSSPKQEATGFAKEKALERQQSFTERVKSKRPAQIDKQRMKKQQADSLAKTQEAKASSEQGASSTVPFVQKVLSSATKPVLMSAAAETIPKTQTAKAVPEPAASSAALPPVHTTPSPYPQPAPMGVVAAIAIPAPIRRQARAFQDLVSSSTSAATFNDLLPLSLDETALVANELKKKYAEKPEVVKNINKTCDVLAAYQKVVQELAQPRAPKIDEANLKLLLEEDGKRQFSLLKNLCKMAILEPAARAFLQAGKNILSREDKKKEPWKTLNQVFVRFKQLETIPRGQFEIKEVTAWKLFQTAVFIETTIRKTQKVANEFFSKEDTELQHDLQTDHEGRNVYLLANHTFSVLDAEGSFKKVTGGVQLPKNAAELPTIIARGTLKVPKPSHVQAAKMEAELASKFRGTGIAEVATWAIHSTPSGEWHAGSSELVNISIIYTKYDGDGTTAIPNERYPSLSTDEMLCFAEDVIHGLTRLHSKNTIHADLKLQNVLVVRDANKKIIGAKIADFGGSFVFNPKEPGKYKSGVAYGSGAYGSPLWTAPEMSNVAHFEGDHFKCDVWAAGFLLSQVVLRKKITQVKSREEMHAQVLKELNTPGATEKETQLRKLIIKMLERDPAKRISAYEALKAINTIARAYPLRSASK